MSAVRCHARSVMKQLSFLLWCVLVVGSLLPAASGTVRSYPAPAGEELSKDYTVKVEGREVPVYVAKVAPADPARRWQAMDDKARSADFFEKASFAYFDMDGPVTVTVSCPGAIRSAKILPSSLNIIPTVQGTSLSLTMTNPKPLTLEINGTWVGALHLFANPLESDVPRPGDPNVLYFGPGIHEATHVVVSNNQTVYIAGGALVRGVRPEESFHISSYSGQRTYSPTFVLKGTCFLPIAT